MIKLNSKIHSQSDCNKLQSSSYLFFEYEDVIKVFYDEDNGLIIHEWLEYNPDGQDALVVEILRNCPAWLLEFNIQPRRISAIN